MRAVPSSALFEHRMRTDVNTLCEIQYSVIRQSNALAVSRIGASFEFPAIRDGDLIHGLRLDIAEVVDEAIDHGGSLAFQGRVSRKGFAGPPIPRMVKSPGPPSPE